MTDKFGALENVPLREAWPHEANNFTPWLADNLDRLAEAIAIDLEPIQTEAPVEQFSADILARNSMDDSVVLIENQLEGSNHTHLGQIMTYLAGLEARTVIWIARDFADAHLSAVRWLNENTTDSFNFFAVQIKVVRIGDSPLVPIFDVQERPSEWDRQIRAVSQRTPADQSARRKFQREFWAYYSERHPDDEIPQVRESANVFHLLEDVGLHIAQGVDQDGVVLYVTKRRGSKLEQSTREYLAPFLPALAESLGIDPNEFTPGASRSLEINASDRENWPQAVDWLHECLTIYRRVLENTPA